MKPAFWMKKKGNKFGAKKTVVDGILFHSKREAEYYGQLKLMKRAGNIQNFERQISFPLYAMHGGLSPDESRKVCDHIVDFLVINIEGKKEVHEVKGMETDVWKLKKKIFEANYPNITYKVIK